MKRRLSFLSVLFTSALLQGCDAPAEGFALPSASDSLQRGAPVEEELDPNLLRQQLSTFLTLRTLQRYASDLEETQMEQKVATIFERQGASRADVRAWLAADLARDVLEQRTGEFADIPLTVDRDELIGELEARAEPYLRSLDDEEPLPEVADDWGGEQPGVPPDLKAESTRPFVHSAYGDHNTSTYKNDAPGMVGFVSYPTPLAEMDFGGALPGHAVACIEDRDCAGLLGEAGAVCGAVDGDADGYSFYEEQQSEYKPCTVVEAGGCFVDGTPHGVLEAHAVAPPSDAAPPWETNSAYGPYYSVCAIMPETPQFCEVRSCVAPPAWTTTEGAAGSTIEIQGRSFIDTDMGAVLTRLTDLQGEPIAAEEFLGAEIDSNSELHVAHNAGSHPYLEYQETHPDTLHVVADTFTWGTDDLGDSIILDQIASSGEYTRYHTGYQAEQYPDLVRFDLPANALPGVYELRLTYHVNAWLQALEAHDVDPTEAIALLVEECEDHHMAQGQSEAAAISQCDELDVPAGELLPGDPLALTNPIYVRVLPGEPAVRYHFDVSQMNIAKPQEGEDDPFLSTVFMKFDPNNPDAPLDCLDLIEAADEVAEIGETEHCEVKAFATQGYDSLDPGAPINLKETFEAAFTVQPGEVVVVATDIWEQDGGPIPPDVLVLTHTINMAIHDALPSDMGGMGWIGWIIGGVGTTVEGSLMLADLFNNPEFLGMSRGVYTFDALSLLTHTEQMGIDISDVRAWQNSGAIELPNLLNTGDSFSYEDSDFFGAGTTDNVGTVFTNELVFMDGELDDSDFESPEDVVWGRYTEFRSMGAVNNDALASPDASIYQLRVDINRL
jgi:hypothetical protein